MRNDHVAPQQETLWRNQVAERVAARKARAPGATGEAACGGTNARSDQAEELAHRAIQRVQRRLEERVAREEAERQEREELERRERSYRGASQPPDVRGRVAIVVDDGLQTSDPSVFAIGECAQHRGQVYGLVAPVWEQAKVLADHITGDNPLAVHARRT